MSIQFENAIAMRLNLLSHYNLSYAEWYEMKKILIYTSRISSVPTNIFDSLVNLTNLERLTLRNNPLEKIPTLKGVYIN